MLFPWLHSQDPMLHHLYRFYFPHIIPLKHLLSASCLLIDGKSQMLLDTTSHLNLRIHTLTAECDLSFAYCEDLCFLKMHHFLSGVGGSI